MNRVKLDQVQRFHRRNRLAELNAQPIAGCGLLINGAFRPRSGRNIVVNGVTSVSL